MVMLTKDAVQTVLSQGFTKYALAKQLGCNPVSINQWLRGTRMSAVYADKVELLFNITVTDTYDTQTTSSRNS